jgi:hypothetical protein
MSDHFLSYTQTHQGKTGASSAQVAEIPPLTKHCLKISYTDSEVISKKPETSIPCFQNEERPTTKI